LTRPLQTLLIGALAALFAGAGLLLYQWRVGAIGEHLPDPAAAGQMVLAASLMGLDDKPQALEQWRGKVLVVNFWATWCAPCREEIPGFIKFQDQYRARGVQFVGIAIDQKERVGPYARDIGINYPVLVGGPENMDFARQVGNRHGVLPFTLVIDRSGKVVTTEIGVLKREKLEGLLKPLL
jgi:thiol-disulfide isomerase/thioredoxin